MSKQKNKNTLLAGHSRVAHSSSTKDEIMAMKFVMEKPEEAIFPLDDKLPVKTFPDYSPWNHNKDAEDKLNNSNYLNKGYFEGPLVSNEYYSARNLIQETLFSSSKNCTSILKELSQHFTKAYHTRNEEINKIRASTNNFKIPPRVTLTALKKEAWLKILANPDVPLLLVSSKLPHGIRNKVLVDSMCNNNVPMNRAIWFTKCSLYSELLLLRRKIQSKQSLSLLTLIPPIDAFESRWLQEWSQQVADYIFKFSREMVAINSPEKKAQYNAKLNYLLTYVQTLYVECLLDRVFFLSCIMKSLKDDLPFDPAHIPKLLELFRSEPDEEAAALSLLLGGKSINYGQILVALTLFRMFWKDILQEDFLCKILSESLLLNYFLIEKIPTHSFKLDSCSNNGALSQGLKQNLLQLISSTVTQLFKHNTNVFIVPNYWMLIGDVLFKILVKEENSLTETELDKLQKVLQLINYRNESLMLNMKYLYQENSAVQNKSVRRSSFMNAEVPSLTSNPTRIVQDIEESDHTYINRAIDDNLRVIEHLDKFKLNNNLTALLKPKSPSTSEYGAWRVKLKLVVFWCVSSYREMGTSTEKILIICNYLKRKVLQALTTRGSSRLKAEFENELLESIFSLAQEPKESVNMYNLYVLINELYQLKIITISSYLRKIIACGVFYMPPQNGDIPERSKDPQIEFHLLILQNLPVLNNKQCDHILKKWTTGGFNFAEHFAKGMEILKAEILDRLMDSSFDDLSDQSLEYINSLNVGLKFLLVNWVTSQMKATISKSPKLIHMSPSIIARLYKFYALSDNLTVFFKVLIKFILTNENKVIIFYMESLYFIAKVIMKHYTLVKFIAGKSYESISTAYELFKLVIVSYKDLLTRETDLFRFSTVWKFIDLSVESSFHKSENRNDDFRKSDISKLRFEKDTVDSPLKILTHGTRQNDNYSAESFKEDLEILLLSGGRCMSFEELEELFKDVESLELSVTPIMFADSSNAEISVKPLLNDFLVYLGKLAESQEQVFYKLFETTRRQLKAANSNAFYTSIRDFAMETVSKIEDTEQVILFFMKLLSFEIFQIFELFSMLDEMREAISKERLDRILLSLLCESKVSEKKLFNYQRLALRTLQIDYQTKHQADLLTLIAKSLRTSESITDGVTLTEFQGDAYEITRQSLIDNTKWTMDFMSQEVSNQEIMILCNHMVPLQREITTISDVGYLASLANEFNLPIVQLMLRTITASTFHNNEDLNKMVNDILQNLHFLFGSNNSFFGEIFNFLDWQSKLLIFTYLETLFLKQSQFYSNWDLDNAMIDGDVHYVTLKASDNGVELLPVLKDFFKKFSVSFVEKVETPAELFQDLSELLTKLLPLLDSNTVEELGDKNVYNTVSIFLRLLIIHKVSLTGAIITNDEVHFSFIKSLVAMLNSWYLSKHEKLKILLYDLLLLIKSSLTQALSVSAEDELMVTSPNQSMTDEKQGMDTITNYNHGGTALAILSSILNLPDPNTTNPFRDGTKEPPCALMLDDDELHRDSDISMVNNSHFVLTTRRRDSISFSPFGIGQQVQPPMPFSIKSFQLIEDTSSALNDGCVNLSMFDAYTTKENPV